MPVLESVVLYVGDKIVSQIIKDEVWTRFKYFFWPKNNYKTQLIKIITETIEEFEKLNPHDYSFGKIPFYQSEIFFEHLSSFVLFQKGSLEIIKRV